MQNVSSTIAEPKTDAEYRAAVKQILADTERLNRQMESDRKEIDLLKVETRTLLAALGVPV